MGFLCKSNPALAFSLSLVTVFVVCYLLFDRTSPETVSSFELDKLADILQRKQSPLFDASHPDPPYISLPPESAPMIPASAPLSGFSQRFFVVGDDFETLVDVTEDVLKGSFARVYGCPLGFVRKDGGLCECPVSPDDVGAQPPFCRVPLFPRCVFIPPPRSNIQVSALYYVQTLPNAMRGDYDRTVIPIEPLVPEDCYEDMAEYFAEHGVRPMVSILRTPRLVRRFKSIQPSTSTSVPSLLLVNRSVPPSGLQDQQDRDGQQDQLDFSFVFRRKNALPYRGSFRRYPTGKRVRCTFIYQHSPPQLDILHSPSESPRFISPYDPRCFCNGHGLCAHSDKNLTTLANVCYCQPGYSGRDCGTRNKCHLQLLSPIREGQTPCYGRGKCIRGLCICTSGLGAGFNCAIDIRAHDSGAASSRLADRDAAFGRRMPRLYVYELPYALSLSVWSHLTTPFSDRVAAGQFTEDALLSPYRVIDPSSADVFFIPFFEEFALLVNYADIARTIARQYPYWNTSGGADHIWAPQTYDTGNIHWFHGRPAADAEFLNQSICLQPQAFVREKVPRYFIENFRVGYDIMLPAYHLVHTTFQIVKHALGRPGVPRNRSLAFFAGRIYDDPDSDPHPRWDVRLFAWLLRDESRSVIVNRIKSADPIVDNAFVVGMAESAFCFATPGFGGGYGDRGDFAVMSGCIPVYLSIAGERRRPYDEILPYDSFSFTFDMSQQSNIIPTLEAVVKDRVRMRELRRNLMAVRRFFCTGALDPSRLELVLRIIALRRSIPEAERNIALKAGLPLNSSSKTVFDVLDGTEPRDGSDFLPWCDSKIVFDTD